MTSHSSVYRFALRSKNNIKKNPLYSDRHVINNKLLLFKYFMNTFMSSTCHSTYHNYSNKPTLRIQINQISHLQKNINKVEMKIRNKTEMRKHSLQRVNLIPS